MWMSTIASATVLINTSCGCCYCLLPAFGRVGWISGCLGRGLGMNIPTWKEAPREGQRGLASGREEEGEMLGRPSKVWV